MGKRMAMISKLEGIHNGYVLVVFDHGFNTVTVTESATGTYRSFHENVDLWELYQSFVEHFNEYIDFKDACLFFKIDLIK